MKLLTLFFSLALSLAAQDLFLCADGELISARAEWTNSRVFLLAGDAPARSIARGTLLLSLPSSADAAWRTAVARFREGRLEAALDLMLPGDALDRIVDMPLERLHLSGRLALVLGRGEILDRLKSHSFPTEKGLIALDLLHWRLEHWMLEGSAKRAAAELLVVEQDVGVRDLDEEERCALMLLGARASRLAGAHEDAARRLKSVLLAAETGHWDERRRLGMCLEAERQERGTHGTPRSLAALKTLRSPEALALVDVVNAERLLEENMPEDALALLSWRQFEGPALPFVRLALARARWAVAIAGDEFRLAGARAELCELARLGEDPGVAAAARRLLAGRF